MTSVFIYVNKQAVGDADHLKAFANADAAETWFEENDPKEWHSSMRSWSESHRAPNRLCNAADRGLGDPVEFVTSIIFPVNGSALAEMLRRLHYIIWIM
jgi:hypothetical protein